MFNVRFVLLSPSLWGRLFIGVGGRKSGRGGRVGIGGARGVGGVFGVKRAERDLVFANDAVHEVVCERVKGKRVFGMSSGFHFRVVEKVCFGAWGWRR